MTDHLLPYNILLGFSMICDYNITQTVIANFISANRSQVRPQCTNAHRKIESLLHKSSWFLKPICHAYVGEDL